MRLRVELIAVCMALAIGPTVKTAVGRDLFVNNESGDDANDGLSSDASGQRKGPFRSIARALRAARNGDHIHIAKTETAYRESLTLQAERHGGVENRPFVIEGHGAVLDGADILSPDQWEAAGPDLFRCSVERKSSHVLFLDGKPAQRRRAAPGETDPPNLDPLEWCLHDGQIYFRVEPGKLPWAYALSHTALPVGITLYDVRHLIVRDLVIQGFALDGINAHDGASDARLAGLTCRGNGRSGISIGGASRVRVEGCLVGDNGESQVRVEGFCRARLVNCDLIDHPLAPALDRQGGRVEVESGVARVSADVPGDR
ncbi:MAG: right-handed parallel beta-helix repeat-containing protein [Planctomycetes bacterium]|nr:right-handed parallel beta-helix repeat-containing protein [Planctomycetota bacterium]